MSTKSSEFARMLQTEVQARLEQLGTGDAEATVERIGARDYWMAALTAAVIVVVFVVTIL